MIAHGHEPYHGEHRHSHPGQRVARFQRPVVLNVTQEPRHEHNRSQVHELEHKNGQGQNDDVSRVQKAEFQDRVRLYDPSHNAATSRKTPATSIATITPEFNQYSRSP